MILDGAGTWLKTVMVLTGRPGIDARPFVQTFLRRTGAQVIGFSDAHFDVASSAFIRFGRGHHPAALNFGDCMSYATASLARMPLLFTGNDFSRTDIPAA